MGVVGSGRQPRYWLLRAQWQGRPVGCRPKVTREPELPSVPCTGCQRRGPGSPGTQGPSLWRALPHMWSVHAQRCTHTCARSSALSWTRASACVSVHPWHHSAVRTSVSLSMGQGLPRDPALVSVLLERRGCRNPRDLGVAAGQGMCPAIGTTGSSTLRARGPAGGRARWVGKGHLTTLCGVRTSVPLGSLCPVSLECRCPHRDALSFPPPSKAWGPMQVMHHDGLCPAPDRAQLSTVWP